MDNRALRSKKILRDNLENALSALDDVCNNLEAEAREKIMGERKRIKYAYTETNMIYEKLNDKICEKIIKKSLPLRVRFFNKIKCIGKSTEGTSIIRIDFIFNNKWEVFEKRYYTEDIKRYLK